MARRLVHDRLRSSATAGTIVSLPAVPVGKALVGRLVMEWDSGAVGNFTLYAGSVADTTTLLATAVPLAAGETYEERFVLLAGEFISLSVSVSNAGGVGLLHVFGEEVDA